MSRIITQLLFKMIYAVGGSVRAALIIEAASMDAADKATILYASQQEDYAGEPIQILSATEIDTDTL